MEDTQQMQCMEVWGGSQLANRQVEMGGLEAFVYSKPYDGASRGGDVYYASSCATGRISRLMLADVSGHGQTVASMAADLRALMRRFVNCLDQAQFVRSLNRQFAGMSTRGNFATAVVMTYFAPTNRLCLCNAGHPRPLVHRAGDDRWKFMESAHSEKPANKPPDEDGPRNLPLGILDIAEYDQMDVDLREGDVMVCYTDALIESRDADGEFLGEDGLLRIANLLGPMEPREFLPALLKEIGDRYPQNLSEDDVTIMVMRPNGKPRRFTLRQKLGAAARFMGTLLKSINPKAERAPFPDFNWANMGGALVPKLNKHWKSGGTPKRPPDPVKA